MSLRLGDVHRLLKTSKVVMDISDITESSFHNHDFLELTYVLEGKASQIIDGRAMTISEGDYFILDYNMYHTYKQIGTTPLKVLNCMFLPKLIDETLADCHAFCEVANNYLIKFDFAHLKDHPSNFIYHDTDDCIRSLLLNMYEEYSQLAPGYLESIRCMLILVLINIMRQIQLPSSVGETKLVQHITSYAREHFSEKVSLQEITQEYNYSLAHISHMFKLETGITFQEYVQQIRIQESCRLLTNTSKKVSEISGLVGYSNIKFFNEIFKRRMGMSPREYRKQVKKETNL